jgi:hypothetical protein
MTVAENNVLTPTDLAFDSIFACSQAKGVAYHPGGHFDGYSGPHLDTNAGRHVQFLCKTLCK